MSCARHLTRPRPSEPLAPPDLRALQRCGCLAPVDLVVLGALARGRTPSTLAREQQWSRRSSQRRVLTIRETLGARSNIQAVVLAIRAGLV